MWVIFIAASIAMVLLVWQSKKLLQYYSLSATDQNLLTQQQHYLPDFNSAKTAILAIRDSVFIAGKVSGKPVAVILRLPITFKLK
ncbi:hypothetical protein MNBD_GAMMA22-290 [hydrothermal vent metagenome]|uniref:Uncharacterized protein n=1 Tax=hydrothermal vent metagenome TaxID=652676 RepID=A0A3B0ZNT1_9ZZZZ